MKRLSQPWPWGLSLLLWLTLLIPSHAATPVNPKILHILNRLSLGPKPGDVERVQQMGVDRYIQQQLDPNTIPEPASLKTQLQSLETLSMSPVELAQEFGRPKQTAEAKATPEQRKAYREKLRQVTEEAVQARLLRATASPRQLEEVMVDFWFNHFNVFANKGQDRLWVGAYEQQAIRPHVLGRFRDLLGATAHHPAMLFYLDNWQNTDPNSPGARGRFKGLNENYARELMELHTLGVNGGYTQKDVVTLAKILTGWTIQQRPNAKNTSPQGFRFDPKRHDSSPKVFLGKTLQGKGEAEGEEALDRLAASPATARHISFRLAQYFVADKPPEALVNRLAQNYLSTGGNLKDLLKTLFSSAEFQDPKFYQAKFKTPYQYVLSAVRATGVEVRNVRPLYTMLQQLGMPLYGCQSPDGYKNTKEAWLNPDAMTRRLSFATALASGRIPLSASPPESLGRRAARQDRSQGSMIATALDPIQLTQTLGNGFSLKTQQAIANNPPALQSALLLGSPEFMHR
jgi:uncharacterized protein (DUF1800 family)